MISADLYADGKVPDERERFTIVVMGLISSISVVLLYCIVLYCIAPYYIVFYCIIL